MAALRRVSELAALLKADHALTPVVAAELEFYLPGILDHLTTENVLSHIRQCAEAEQLSVDNVTAEKGHEQFEVSFSPSHDGEKLSERIERFKKELARTFAPHKVDPSFAAKPFADQPGSGLHIHLHLEDSQGRNVFTRYGDEWDDPFSPELLYSLGGLMELMNATMLFFAPAEDSFTRFIPKSNTPMTISWGTNNRTVALRLPTKAITNKHIEHRVAGSDADASTVISAILAGVHYGLTQKCEPGDAVYGDASLPQYGLTALAKDAAEAEHFFQENETKLEPYLA